VKLFISHASEDKEDFVRPLAEALRSEYQVWYDEYELTLGDSLLRKIDEGLATCDFGIVVLSHAFFAKKWPQTELDGLFARETAARKIILPIWKDVTQEDVCRFSPTLAGRFAVSASLGVQAVVAEIKRAIEVSERTRQISAIGSATRRLKKLAQSLQESRDAALLRGSGEGANLVGGEAHSLQQMIQDSLSEVSRGSETLKFHFSKPSQQVFYAHSNLGVGLCLALRHLAINSASDCSLAACIFHQEPQPFGERGKAKELWNCDFKPTFDSAKRVVWIDDSDRKIYLTEELVAHLTDKLAEEIEREIDRE